MSEYNFMRLPEEYTKNAVFTILPVPFEHNVTFGEGAQNGPGAIIAASEHLEYYDEQFDCEPFTQGITVLPEQKFTEPEAMVAGVAAAYPEKGFVIGLGGDHSVSIGLVKGLAKRGEKFSVLVLDAHADFRDSWNGSSLNHACIVREISKEHSVGLIGVRAMDVDEARLIAEQNIPLVKAHEFSMEKVEALIDRLEDNVYVSIDVDVFDPSFIRETGTPEPGGLTWREVIAILEMVFEKKHVVGADIVEFAAKSDKAEAFAMAKLTYKLMALSHTFK